MNSYTQQYRSRHSTSRAQHVDRLLTSNSEKKPRDISLGIESQKRGFGCIKFKQMKAVRPRRPRCRARPAWPSGTGRRRPLGWRPRRRRGRRPPCLTAAQNTLVGRKMGQRGGGQGRDTRETKANREREGESQMDKRQTDVCTTQKRIFFSTRAPLALRDGDGVP